MKIKRRQTKIVFISIAIMMLLSPSLISIFYFNSQSYEYSDKITTPKTSDVAGSDLYAEAIRAYVAGNSSLLKHSLFSNDTNIIKNIDLEDPAFYKCNIYLSASNNHTADIFPFSLGERGVEDQFKSSHGTLIGFLYYDDDLSSNEANSKSERAFEIIRRKLEMDLIHVNASHSNYYPFIAYYPKWNDLLEKITENIPMDGYWNAFDLERLSSNSYTSQNHLSFSYAMINSPDIFEGEIDFGNDQLDFNTGVSKSSFLKGGSMADLFEQIFTISEANQDLFGNMSMFLGENDTTISTQGFENMTSIGGNFSLSKDSHYSILEVQYEGRDEGIKRIGDNKYEFNLFKALGYQEELLEPSKKIYIALNGAFLSELDINILCTDIIDTTPQVSEFSDYLLEQISFLLSLTDTDFDVETLENYSFEVFWKDFGGLKKNFMNIINLNDDFDVVNFLPILGFTGFASYPCGLLNPLDEYKVQYKLEKTEPNLKLTNQLIGENASFGAYNTFDFNITAENVGNTTVYGTPTSIPIDLETAIYLVFLLEGADPTSAEEFESTLREIVANDNNYQEYDSLEDFFNFDKDPKIFHFDTNGDGSNDYYFPDPFNISNLYPYNENMEDVINTMLIEHSQVISQTDLSPGELKTIFTNQYSIWNDDNWESSPGESLSYLDNNYDISDNDTYSSFHSLNFTINDGLSLPLVFHGKEDKSTNPSMALAQDNESWIIYSEEYQGQETAEVQFMAQNSTVIDFNDNTLNRIALKFNLTNGFEDVELDIFNFTSETFINLGANLLSVNGSERTYGLTKYNNSIADVFENPEQGEYTLIFRIRKQSDSSFNITIENIDIEFLRRDINPIKLQSTVKYSSSSGNTRYIKYSNSITLSTGNMTSLVAYASLLDYNSNPGSLNTYKLKIKNIGTKIAQNITIDIPIPGIIKDTNKFILKDNYLEYSQEFLTSGQQEEINFTYYVPNSAILREPRITYNNIKSLEKGNSTKLSSSPNNLFCVAPINYENTFPYLRTIKLWLNSSTNGPAINDIFNISLNIKNLGPSELNISQLKITSNDKYGDLLRTSNEIMTFNNIAYNQIKSMNFSLKKTDWKGYLYPAIKRLLNNESDTFQIYNSNPLIIGTIDFEITKSVNVHEVEIGDQIEVSIAIKNTGSICIKDLKIDDELSYSGHFSLVSGRFIKIIDCLNPNEITYLNYTIRSTSEAKTTLKGAIISYNYLYSSEIQSNSISMKIITPKLRQYLQIIIPSLIGLSMFGGFLYYTFIYKRKQLEAERKEIKILKQTSRDNIMSVETSLREYLTKRNLKEEKDSKR